MVLKVYCESAIIEYIVIYLLLCQIIAFLNYVIKVFSDIIYKPEVIKYHLGLYIIINLLKTYV